jgi:hypothetical protein
MKLSEMSMRELKRCLQATRDFAGSDSYGAKVLKSELDRRRERKRARKKSAEQGQRGGAY